MSSKVLRSIFAVTRRGQRHVVPSTQAIREIHVSTPLYKKAKSKRSVAEETFNESESYNNQEDDSDVDLFDLSADTSTAPASSSARLAELHGQLNELVRIARSASASGSSSSSGDGSDRVAIKERNAALNGYRVGLLRRIVQLTPEEGVDGLRDVLRGWRVIGGRVTGQTAEELVGRLCNLNRADLALEFIENRDQYNLPPISLRAQTKIHHSLLTSPPTGTSASTPLPSITNKSSFSPTLAMLHLALRQRQSQPLRSEEVDKLVSGLKKLKYDVKDAEAWRSEGRAVLDSAGGAWAEAGRRIEEAAA